MIQTSIQVTSKTKENEIPKLLATFSQIILALHLLNVESAFKLSWKLEQLRNQYNKKFPKLWMKIDR